MFRIFSCKFCYKCLVNNSKLVSVKRYKFSCSGFEFDSYLCLCSVSLCNHPIDHVSQM